MNAQDVGVKVLRIGQLDHEHVHRKTPLRWVALPSVDARGFMVFYSNERVVCKQKGSWTQIFSSANVDVD